MANRHERRKATKVMRMEVRETSPEELRKMSSMCAWAGCTAVTADPDKAGWSKLLLYTGETKIDFTKINPRHMARDCVLCPEHARHLDEHLLWGVGGQLRNVAGSA